MPINACHAIVDGAGLERDPRSEREPRGPQRNARIAPGQVVERGAEVRHLSLALVERAGAAADAAEVEAEHRAADPGQPLGSLVDGFRVHRSAELRVRMGEHDGGPGRGVLRERLLDQGLETSGGAGQIAKSGHARIQ